MITRKDYMDGHATFSAYYREIYKDAGIDSTGHRILQRVKAALADGDEHLNKIPLGTWDGMGSDPGLRANLSRAFKAHGDFWSLAGSVCALKQAARDAVEE